MKISKKTMAQIIVIIIALFTLSGCNIFDNGSRSFLTEKMNEIPIEIEYDGYKLVAYEPPLKTVNYFSGEVEFNGSVMKIEYDYKIDDKTYSDYFVNYKEKTLYINDEFMRDHSETYVKIHQIWSTFKNRNNAKENKSKIIAVYPFDGQLFIVTNGIIGKFNMRQVVDSIPLTLYVLDWDSEKIYYAGYYQDYFEPNLPVSIIKKTED